MDIQAKPGTKVKFIGKGSYDNDMHNAFDHMDVGEVFTVKNIDIDPWISHVEFEELPGITFNTVMFEEVEVKNSFLKSMDEFSKAMQEGAEQWEGECDEYWNKLPYEQKLKAFHSVCKRIYEGDVKKEGSFRYVLYDVFGFGPDSYIVGMECNYMELHNYIQDGVASHRNYVEKDKNEHLPKDL